MRASSRRAALALLVCLGPTTAVAAVIENSALRLEVAEADGSLVSLRHKTGGIEFITDSTRARLFELMVPDATNPSRRIASWQQRASSVRVVGDRIEVRYSGLRPDEQQYRFGSGLLDVPQPVLPIDVTVTLSLDGEHVTAALDLDNWSRTTVAGVAFPYVGGLAPARAGEPASIVVPSLAVRRYTNTAGALSGQRALRYPAVLASPWLDYELGQAASLGIEVRGPLEAQDAWFSLSPGPFRPGSAYRGRYDYPFVAWIHYPHVASGQRWSSPPSRLHVHESDWHAIAREQREWQRSTRAPLRDATWDARLGFATYRLQRDDGTIDHRYADLTALADVARTAGLDTLVVEGWRVHEGTSNRAPFEEVADVRLGGTATLRRSLEALQAVGTRAYLAFHPAVLEVFGRLTPEQDASWTVRTRRGAHQLPADFLYHTNDAPRVFDGPVYAAEIDPASPASAFLLEAAARLQRDCGARHLWLKGVGQRAFLSYNPYHGVPPQAAYARGYATLLGGLRDRFGRDGLLNEGSNDLVDGYAGAAYGWNQAVDAAVLAYARPWARLSTDVEALDYAAANRAFAHGQLLNVIVDGGRGSVADYPEFARHLNALQALKAATVDYLGAAEFRDHDGVRNANLDPGVVLATHVNEAARKSSIVLTNLTPEPRTARFELQAAGLVARRYPGGTKEVGLGGVVSISLQPFEVQVLAIDARL